MAAFVSICPLVLWRDWLKSLVLSEGSLALVPILSGCGFGSSRGKLTTVDAGVKQGSDLVVLCPRLSSCGGYLGWLSPWLLARAVERTALAVPSSCLGRARPGSSEGPSGKRDWEVLSGLTPTDHARASSGRVLQIAAIEPNDHL